MYYSSLPLRSYNAIFNFVDGARNIGKSTAFKVVGIQRAHQGKGGMYWVRRYTKEVQKTIDKFCNPLLLRLVGMSLYHKERNPNGQLKKDGPKLYVKDYKGEWVLAVQFVALCEAANYRSADDDWFNMLVFDEYTTTPERYKYYRGDEARDFFDLYISLKREGRMQCFFLGNKETRLNPYKRYLGIKPLPLSFQGIRTFKAGSIAVEQINDVENAEEAYSDKLRSAFKGTPYLSYLLDGRVKTERKVGIKDFEKASASLYGQFEKAGNAFSVYTVKTLYYISKDINAASTVYADTKDIKYPLQRALINAHKSELYGLRNALVDNRVYYTSQEAVELAAPFISWLCGIR